jgi:transcriptional regulator with XRE-family HTH domain
MPETLQPIKITPAELIRILMKHKWKQGAIAKAAKTTQPTISRILSGRHRSPSYEIVEALRELVNGLGQFKKMPSGSK